MRWTAGTRTMSDIHQYQRGSWRGILSRVIATFLFMFAP